jgi:hypothetical protein
VTVPVPEPGSKRKMTVSQRSPEQLGAAPQEWLAGRLAGPGQPGPHGRPVISPRYDLTAQFEVISQVAARCDVPLPALRWNEPAGASASNLAVRSPPRRAAASARPCRRRTVVIAGPAGRTAQGGYRCLMGH